MFEKDAFDVNVQIKRECIYCNSRLNLTYITEVKNNGEEYEVFICDICIKEKVKIQFDDWTDEEGNYINPIQ